MADDPFAGFKLSSQATPAKLDQRLFSSEPTPPQSVPSKPENGPKTPRSDPKPPTTTRREQVAEKAALASPSLSKTAFSLDDQPLYKASYLFTQEEQEALEDLKLELSRQYGDKVFKNDLIRAALHMLVEDYRAKDRESYVYRKVKRR